MNQTHQALAIAIACTACGSSQSPQQATPVEVPRLSEGVAEASAAGVVHERHTGTLEEGDELQPTDGSFQDLYTFTTIRGAAIEIDMRSVDFDAYLMLSDPESNKVSESDDAVPGQSDARITIIAPATGEYTVVANTYLAGQSGDYELEIRATPPGPSTPTQGPVEWTLAGTSWLPISRAEHSNVIYGSRAGDHAVLNGHIVALHNPSLAALEGQQGPLTLILEQALSEATLGALAGLSHLAVEVPGDGVLEQVVALRGVELVHARYAISDDTVAHLESMPRLRHLVVDNASMLTSAGIARLASLTQLETLNLDRATLNESDLQQLSALTSLKHLGIMGVTLGNLSGVGLRHLATLTNLESLSFHFTSVVCADLSPLLSRLIRLQYLNLAETDVDQGCIPVLTTLTDLRQVVLRGTNLLRAELAAHPRLEAVADFTEPNI